MTERLRLNHAVIKYGDSTVINDVSVCATPGEIIFITGANGSGKSTLTKGIAGLLPLSSGELMRTQRMSYVPQFEDADKNFPARVNEIVLTGRQRPGKLFYTREDKNAAMNAMSELGIDSLADNEIRTLGGPEILLLDEPCAGLDAESHEVLFSLLRKLLSNGCAVLMVTHDISDIEWISTGRIIKLKNGRIINE